ncbi:hypothetical protein EX30DRAFT_314191 [Ascodesmis nigricans]|uniref:DNA polymerase epsilon subunit C n=1 Tax=Ascodesmis nigricans TaxID=341454 RepID=A0A4V3SJT1_9PEZI|nr:hypothetical protein EX30DRAFT_314191 [Ascodesmis nigricans]
MELWNRLIGGTGSSTGGHPQKLATPLTPEERLHKFKSNWQSLLHSWRNARENDPSSHDLLRSRIKRINDMLVEEEKKVANNRRLCMNFCYENQVFIAVSKIGQNGSLGEVRETISLFSIFIDNEDEDFVGFESFAQSLIAFLETTNRMKLQEVETEFVELLFGIAAKIRMNPNNLRVWFTKDDSEDTPEELPSGEASQRFAGLTNKEQFPLFYLLIEYVHQEGRVGDFARTGLLYIVEATSSSKDLEQWLVQSDLSTLMASGLGALYSQLSRKLVMTYPTEEPPTILTVSDFSAKPPSFDAVSSSSPEFQTHLETFLSYLVFWQDVLEHCHSDEVKQTLLAHFQVLFLQQLLYPSLLESSDIDGGSSVAVLTYVRVMLDTLDHADMIHLILSYLMNLPEKPLQVLSPSLKAKRRQSIDMLSRAASLEDNPTPAIYSLADLILTTLGSKSPQTASSTLRLISTVLRKHYPYAMSTLLKTTPLSNTAPARTIGAYNTEIDLFFSLVTDIAVENSAALTYEGHLRDILTLLESHPCSARLLGLKPSASAPAPALSVNDPMSRMHIHTIAPHDPLLQGLLDILSSFFSNPVETNLVLTAAIIDLGACAWMRPEGWLYFDPNSYIFSSSENPHDAADSSGDSTSDDDDDLSDMEDELAEILAGTITTNVDSREDIFAIKSRHRQSALRRSRLRPDLEASPPPPIVSILRALTQQVQDFRREIADFDERLSEHRNNFEVTDSLSEALNSPPPSFPPGSSSAGTAPRKIDPFNALSLVTRPMSRGPSSTGASTTMGAPVRRPRAVTTGRDEVMLAPPPVKTPRKGIHLPPPPEDDEDEDERKDEGGDEEERAYREQARADRKKLEREQEGRKVTLRHVLTNVMILQEFILELAALTQARASLYGDVKYA